MLHLPAALTAYYTVLAALLGLVMGSFLNCFAYRYGVSSKLDTAESGLSDVSHTHDKSKKNESVLRGRSKCALCGHTLSSRELVPVFSWLFQKGRCRHCGGKISPLYIVAELVCGALFVSVPLHFGFSLEAIKYLVFVSLLFTAAFCDLHSGLIPDRLILIGAVTAFGFAFFSPDGIVRALINTAIGGFSVSLPLFIFVLIFDKIKKRETMGGGDIKLMFMIGLFFDWKLNILIIILACLLGLLFTLFNKKEGSGGERTFPFAPALTAAAWLTMLFGERVIDLYLGLFLF